MLMNYSITAWIGVLEYFAILLGLFASMCIISTKLTYLRFRSEYKIKKPRTKKKIDKQIFFDVA